MTKVWFLQANPAQYDIDIALERLDQIWWRVPQHRAEVHIGETVLVWRAGEQPGIVGVAGASEGMSKE
jgi:hypothetical protein